MNFVVLDASIWVARLVPQDVFHQVVSSWMTAQRSAGMTFLSPALLLAEVAGAISRRTGDIELALRAVQAIKNLPELRIVDLDRSLVEEAARLAASLSLRGADSFYVALAARLGMPLVTQDQEQRARCERLIQVISL